VAKQEILLESGTNEVEIAEFGLCSQSFGVNVAKIREFIPFEGVTVSRLPGRHPSVDGVFMLRGKPIPLVDLSRHLNLSQPKSSNQPVVVVTEFNHMTTAFIADYIHRIHRVSWAEFKPLSAVVASGSPCVVGSINLEEHEVLVLDLEHIIGEIFPQSIINYDEAAFAAKPPQPLRETSPLVFAEDSAIIRHQVGKILTSVGYTDLTVFDNGQGAFDHISRLKEEAEAEGQELGSRLALVLTDIEMPRMDGLTLCRRLRGELGTKLPVVIFSSLINEQMARKCESVGADAYTSKPETEKLIQIIDGLCLGE
jgi:two-component system chemotaxis response regulator CheV